MSKKRIDSITKEKDENRYRGGLLAVSFTTGMVGAARFGNAEKAAGRWYMQQSLRKSGENVSLSLSASRFTFLLRKPLHMPSFQQLHLPRVSFLSCCPTRGHSSQLSLIYSANTIVMWPRSMVIFLCQTSTSQQRLARWRRLPLEIASSLESPITPLLTHSCLTGWATTPWLSLVSL